MIINSFGSSDVFALADIAKPEIKADHVLVNIEASSVNTLDTMIRLMGDKLPFAPQLPAVLGLGFAGTIEAVGKGVTQFSVGDEVYGCAGGVAYLPGTLAEYIVADANLIARKAQNLNMREAAAIRVVGITAYEGLMRANTSKGQNVLVHGGSGALRPVLDELIFSLKEAGQAQERLSSGQGMGKVVINIKPT
ncbi:MAG: NADPH2:quinone reductase [Bermanella sp.]|jgi:NADPH2:quinone reductase